MTWVSDGFPTVALDATCWGTTVTGPGATVGLPTVAEDATGVPTTTDWSAAAAAPNTA